MSKMILHVIPDYRKGGAEKVVQSLRYSDSNKKQRLLVFVADTSDKNGSGPDICLRMNPRNISSIFFLRKILRKYLNDSPDLIVHVHLTWPFIFLPVAAFGMNIKLIYTEHSTYNKRRNFVLFKVIDQFLYRRYSRIVCISEGVRSSLLGWIGAEFASRVTVIHNGVDLYEEVLERRRFVGPKLNLLSVGSLQASKGFDVVIQSLPKIRNLVNSYTIVGDGPLSNKLAQLSEETGVSDLVRFTGRQDEVKRFYEEADILLVPSLWEGFGLVAVEGMSAGLPVIASKVDGLSEVISGPAGNRLISAYSDPGAWACMIKELSKELVLSASSFQDSAVKHASRFSSKKMWLSYDQLYDHIFDE